MTVAKHLPAQRNLAKKFINWDLVERRCDQYPAIGRAFDLNTLQAGIDKPPYYCHYMTWRIGTWDDESLIARLDQLLCCAEALPNWEHESALFSSTDFAEFWSLLWQLQVAEYFCKVGTDVRWAKSGPDLSVDVRGERWFIECYTPRKSFGLLSFLTDLLNCLDSTIHTSYDLCMPFQLPNNSKRSTFLDEVLSPFLNPAYLADAKEAARNKYPIILYSDPSSSLKVYVEGNDIDAYTPNVVPNGAGDPKHYLAIVLREAIKAKWQSNALDRHRPNLLAVNYLLSTDFQFAVNSSRSCGWELADLGLQPHLDALAVSIVGINEQLTKKALKVVHVFSSDGQRASEFADVA